MTDKNDTDEKAFKEASREAGRRIVRNLPKDINRIREKRLLMDKSPSLYLIKGGKYENN